MPIDVPILVSEMNLHTCRTLVYAVVLLRESPYWCHLGYKKTIMVYNVSMQETPPPTLLGSIYIPRALRKHSHVSGYVVDKRRHGSGT